MKDTSPNPSTQALVGSEGPDIRAERVADLLIAEREIDIGATGLRLIANQIRAAVEAEREAIVRKGENWQRDPELTGEERDILEAFCEDIRARGSKPSDG